MSMEKIREYLLVAGFFIGIGGWMMLYLIIAITQGGDKAEALMDKENEIKTIVISLVLTFLFIAPLMGWYK